jgi:hypothetical protein
MELQVEEQQRWAVGTGVRYTQYSFEDERAHLWEAGLGLSYRATPWLNVGAEISYGWFDSDEGRSSGVMLPHFFADVHLPVAKNWEAVVSMGAATPGGDEGLVGDHWELTPGIALRHDRRGWFAEAGANLVFVLGGTDHNHEGEGDADHDSHEEEEQGEEEDHEAEDGHGHVEEHGHAPGDFHEVVDPHGECEVNYYATFGVRLLDERLTLEGRFHGVHVISGETPDRDYLRAGARAIYRLKENWAIRTEASVPITDARRNQWQASLSLQVSF